MRSIVLLLVLAASARAQPHGLTEADRARLGEAFRLAVVVGDDLFPGWSAVPFAVLLVTGEREVLVRHPTPTPDFELVDAFDPLLGGPVYARDRQFAPTLLATFPAVGGVPTVVVGTPEATDLGSTAWVLTLLHEHLHQLQMASPGYAEGVAALDLADGDASGMWMLTYPFPYNDPDVATHIAAYRDALLSFADSPARSPLPVGEGPAVQQSDTDALRAARAALDAALAPADARYLAFQLWQEGVARYSELRVAQMAMTGGEPVAAYRALPDVLPYAAAADTVRERLARDLARLDLAADQRIAFYALGAAGAVALDAIRPGWRQRYLAEPFALERLGVE